MLGERIGGRYEVLSVIGGGGMAVVYKARDVILDRLVAVKVLRAEFSNDNEFIQRFRREAHSVTSLSHPNIVNIYDVDDNTDEKPEGQPGDVYYIVMQYVEGETLKDLIRREAPLPLGQALHIMDQITSAIQHAHEQHIVHRDIKPQNILIDYEGQIKVTDFGIALAMSSATITHTNSVMGSAHYFSPEQARGGYANTKSDIYSLGIVLFEMLTGELPFSGTSPISVALKHLQEDIPEPRELNPAIPQSVENIILRALTKDPNHRYETVEDMRDDLRTALDPERLNEPKFIVPDEEGETTRIMAPLVMAADGSDGGNGGPGNENPDGHDGDGKKKRRLPKILLIILLLLILIGGAAYAAFSFIPDLLYIKSVTVPKVVGMDESKAHSLLKKKQLKVDTQKVVNDKYAKGKVVRQTPLAKTSVKVGSAVHLFVSKGPKKITVDNYMGKDKDSVQLLLTGTHFKKVRYQSSYSDTYSQGVIFDQNPAPETKVIPGKTVLVLTYSRGPESVQVPSLSGSTQQEAQNILNANGLTPDYQGEEYSDSVTKGQVTRQSPDAETTINKGDKVQFWISEGPKPPPEQQSGAMQPGPIPFQQPVKVEVPSNNNGNGKGKPVDVKIVYSDMNHDQQTYVDEKIHDTKTYNMPLTVAPGGQVEVWVYVNNQLQDHFTKSYKDVMNETSGGD